ncbi:MAG: hypothetical protein KAY24_06985 [Candidatus Eisenbacteria sp.]|nr:hypothetical protein [Candidatus Eisenbacteria bacterium]
MRTCFVIQPFDHGPFDKRYKDVFVPVIESAGLDPYRVDLDPSVSIPINTIERMIRATAVCLVDITEDNPNVWFELGYAIASHTDVILVCSDKRTEGFPFDVQHRKIIRYSTESSSDFDVLKELIAARIQALLSKQDTLDAVKDASPMEEVEGLSQYEIVALVSIAQNVDGPSESVSAYVIREDMEKSGFTRIATTLALTGLLRQKLVRSIEAESFNHDPYTAYVLEERAMEWLLDHQELFAMRCTPQPSERATGDVDDDDLPF